MIGPPLMKLSTRKFPVSVWPVPGTPAGAAEAAAGCAGADGASAGAGDNPGIPAGLIVGAPGATAGAVVAGIVPAGGAELAGAVVAGELATGGGGGGVWPKAFSANVSEQRETVSSFFIG
jgi:hypothetical protein